MLFIDCTAKIFFSAEKYSYFSNFSMNICCGYSLEMPHRGISNEYPQHMFLWRNKKNIYLDVHLIWIYEMTDRCRPGGGWVRQRCSVSYVTGLGGGEGVQLRLAYSWTRPAILAAGKGRRECFYFFCFFTFIHFPLSLLFLSSPLLSFFSLSLGDGTQ